jgi:uncharacterized membrane protein
MKEEIKEAAREKIEATLLVATMEADSPDLYWKIDKDRQLELNKRDKFEVEVWSYILSLIEKDNKL